MPRGDPYRDPDLGSDEAEPGLISERALERAKPLDALEFGCTVTEVKEWLMPEPTDGIELETVSGPASLRVHGMARLAFCPSARLIFANGCGRSATRPELHAAERLCANRSVGVDLLQDMRKNEKIKELFVWLAEKGAFDILTDQPNDAT